MRSIELKGVAFITGAASGIGLATAIAFAEQGARVALSDVNEVGIKKVAAELEASHPNQILALTIDVSSEESIIAGVQATVKKWGRIDYAFNNAGVVSQSFLPLSETRTEEYEFINRIDARGVFICMREQLKVMLKQEPLCHGSSRGSIINMSSRAGLSGTAMLGSYTGAKHAVIGLTKASAIENALNGIRVNAICPGLIETPGHAPGSGDIDKDNLLLVPMKKWGRVNNIVDGVMYLASDLSSYVTGVALEIDGGIAAHG